MELAQYAEQSAARGVAAIGMFNGQAKQAARCDDFSTSPDLTPAPQAPPPQSEDSGQGEAQKDPTSERARNGHKMIREVAAKAGIETTHFDAFIQQHLGYELEREDDADVLGKVYQLIVKNIKTDAAGFKDHCRSLFENDTQ